MGLEFARMMSRLIAKGSPFPWHHFANRHAPRLNSFARASNSASFARYFREGCA